MPPRADIVTAGLRPELFSDPVSRRLGRGALAVALAALVVAGFGLRAAGLGAEGLSEDELNKLEAVADYRARGLTGANGEHPLLMKALQTASVVAAERYNASPLVAARPAQLRVTTEGALRLPSAAFGALTAVLIFLVAAELFGAEVGLVGAALWALDPQAAGFNRIAKEDTFLLFFFLLANAFWLRGQRVAEGGSGRGAEPYYWATGAAFGAMVASKYLPHFVAVSICYYYIFQGIPAVRWRLGKPRVLFMFVVMGAVFLLCNPTILLPETWRQMLAFASQSRVGHDSYEFMGVLYDHRMTTWLEGVPWYFYYVFAGVKLPPLTVAAFLAGLPLLFLRRLGDGRYFLLWWIFYWLPFTVLGGKFTRYFTFVLPAVLIVAAVGAQFAARRLARATAARVGGGRLRLLLRAGLPALVLIAAAWAAAGSAPHYRLYTNVLGGGEARAGDYFPHDEFYDAAVRPAVFEVARRARVGARVASETPRLVAFYARRAGRPDLQAVSLSDEAALRGLGEGDFAIAARGRRYRSNDALLEALGEGASPSLRVPLGRTTAANVYELDRASLPLVAAHAR